jgi:hypothetical protein
LSPRRTAFGRACWGVPVSPRVPQGVEEASHVRVDVLDHGVDLRQCLRQGRVEGGGRGRLQGRMRRVVGHPGEEGAVPGADEVEGAVRDEVRHVALHFHGAALHVKDRILVMVAAGRVGGLADAAALEGERPFEALVLRPQRRVVPQVPLPEDARPVRGLEGFGERPFVPVHEGAADKRIDHAGAVVPAAGQEAGPRGGADGGDVVALDLDRFPGKSIQTRGLQIPGSVAAEVRHPLVVGEDDEDVRRRGGRRA